MQIHVLENLVRERGSNVIKKTPQLDCLTHFFYIDTRILHNFAL